MFYKLDYYRNTQPDDYKTILGEAKAGHPQAESELEIVLGSYERGYQWLTEAARFFLDEKWIHDEEGGRFASLRELLASLWTPILGYLPPLKPRVYRNGTIDGTAVRDFPFRDFSGLLLPLNPEGERFLKDTPLTKLSVCYDAIRQTVFPDEAKILPPGVKPAPLYMLINSMRNFDAQVEWGTDFYDIGSPVTYIIENLPHKIGHFLHSCVRSGWAREVRTSQVVFAKKEDSYKSEGIAELCQSLILQSLKRRFPILGHYNLRKHHLFIQSDAEREEHNHHTWGFLWMKTIFELFDKNFAHTVFLASQPGFFIEDMMASPELQTDAVKTDSQDLSPKSFPRQKREPGRTHAYAFPSCILEVEGDSFRIVEHGDYSFIVPEPIRKDR